MQIDPVQEWQRLTKLYREMGDVDLRELAMQYADLTDAAKQHIVKVGYEPTYGARPLKRVLQRELETALARKLLAGEIRDGQKVTVDYDRSKDELTFRGE